MICCYLDMDNFYSNAYGNEPIVVNDKDFIISKPIWSTVQKDMLLTDSTPDSSIIYVTRKDRQEFYGMIIHLFYLIRKYTRHNYPCIVCMSILTDFSLTLLFLFLIYYLNAKG